MNVTLVTGNKRKIEEARASLMQHGLELSAVQLDIDEIQHHDPAKITEAKARAAYEKLQQPIVVNDAHWSIPALGGFPGGYMKDVNSWFTPEDFLALMRGKTDRSILLSEVVAYFDGVQYKTFIEEWRGRFVDAPRGGGSWSLDKVIAKDGDELTVAERWDRRDDGSADEQDYYIGVWNICAEWLKKSA